MQIENHIIVGLYLSFLIKSVSIFWIVSIREMFILFSLVFSSSCVIIPSRNCCIWVLSWLEMLISLELNFLFFKAISKPSDFSDLPSAINLLHCLSILRVLFSFKLITTTFLMHEKFKSEEIYCLFWDYKYIARLARISLYLGLRYKYV